jgi:hypothetical protein
MDLLDIRKWFDAEVERLQSRLDAGDYTRAQFDNDLLALKAERDLKMGGLDDHEEVVEGGGGLKDLDEDTAMLPDGCESKKCLSRMLRTRPTSECPT